MVFTHNLEPIDTVNQIKKRTVFSVYAPCSQQQASATINIWTHMCSYIRRQFSKILSIWTKRCCIPKTTADGTHSFVGLTDLLANELAKATTFDKFYFESNV